MDLIEIKITNWDKYNARQDVKRAWWFKISNSLFEDHEFFDFTHAEICFWIYVLSLASKSGKGIVRVIFHHANHIGRFKNSDIETAIKKLERNGCLEILSDVSDTNPLLGCNEDVSSDKKRLEKRREETTLPQNRKLEVFVHAALADPLLDKHLSQLSQTIQEKWVETYGASWVKDELKKSLLWCEANPARKPRSMWARFLNGWLTRGWERHRMTLPSQSVRKSLTEVLKEREKKNEAT